MRCNNEVLMNKITNNKINKNVELRLTVLADLPDCKKLRADKYIKIVDSSGVEVTTTALYNKFKTPENAFECERTGCVNTGTLYVGNDDGNVVYRLPYDAIEFQAGVVTFYATGFTGDKTVKFKIGDDEDMTNANIYEQTITGKGDEYVPVIIDLSQPPTIQEGNGWTPARSGAYISILVPDIDAGISSISMFDRMSDFAVSDVVVIGCLSEIGGEKAFDAAEATCWDSGYDETSDKAYEVTLTGKSVTPNYFKLDPSYGKGKATTGWMSVNVESTVEADGDYGVVVIPDMNTATCGFLTAQIANGCDVTGGQLVKLNIPTKVDLDENQYNVIPNDNGSTTIYFNKALVGEAVKISYPQIQEGITERVYNDENIGSVRVKAEEIVTQSDGVKIVRIYENVLVTSFPSTINEDETEFSFTLSVQKGADGHRVREYVIGQ